jgi:hypothetical protein
MRAALVALGSSLALLSCSHAPPPAASPARPAVRHVAFLAGKRVGAQSTTVRPDGTWVIDYEYNDRGRGPRTHTEMRLDARGLPDSLHTTGVDYFKASAEETLRGEGGVLRWKNKQEQGTSPAGRSGFFLSLTARRPRSRSWPAPRWPRPTAAWPSIRPARSARGRSIASP